MTKPENCENTRCHTVNFELEGPESGPRLRFQVNLINFKLNHRRAPGLAVESGWEKGSRVGVMGTERTECHSKGRWGGVAVGRHCVADRARKSPGRGAGRALAEALRLNVTLT